MTLQKCLNESVRWELSNLKVFDSKAYVLLKESDASARSKKLKARAFVKYLVEYDSINIFRVWNLEKWDVNEYRNIIFDEESFLNTYQAKNQLKKFVRREHVEYYERSVQISQTNDILEELNSDEDEWVKKSVREKIVKQSVETLRVKDSIQNVNQSFEDDDHDQLLTLERSSLRDTSKLMNYRQIDSKTSELIDIINRQIDLKKDRHQKIDNLHTDMKTHLSFDRS